MNILNEEKFSLTLEVLRITQDTLEAGHDIDDLISHGIDLMSSLLPESASLEEIRYDNACTLLTAAGIPLSSSIIIYTELVCICTCVTYVYYVHM